MIAKSKPQKTKPNRTDNNKQNQKQPKPKWQTQTKGQIVSTGQYEMIVFEKCCTQILIRPIRARFDPIPSHPRPIRSNSDHGTLWLIPNTVSERYPSRTLGPPSSFTGVPLALRPLDGRPSGGPINLQLMRNFHESSTWALATTIHSEGWNNIIG